MLKNEFESQNFVIFVDNLGRFDNDMIISNRYAYVVSCPTHTKNLKRYLICVCLFLLVEEWRTTIVQIELHQIFGEIFPIFYLCKWQLFHNLKLHTYAKEDFTIFLRDG